MRVLLVILGMLFVSLVVLWSRLEVWEQSRLLGIFVPSLVASAVMTVILVPTALFVGWSTERWSTKRRQPKTPARHRGIPNEKVSDRPVFDRHGDPPRNRSGSFHLLH